MSGMTQIELDRLAIGLCGSWRFGWSGARLDVKSAAEAESRGVRFYGCAVPGNFELDLEAAGIMPDAFFGMNPVKVNAFAQDKHVYYTREFDVPAVRGKPTLIFEGLDCFTDIYVNGAFAAATDNMLVEHEIDASGLLRPGCNELFVRIRPALAEAEKFAYDQSLLAGMVNLESVYVRKAPHMYGWDIMPRFLSAGIYRPARIEFRAGERISECYLRTQGLSGDRETAFEHLYYKLETLPGAAYAVRLEGACGESRFTEERPVFFGAGAMDFTIQNPKLWQTNNRGAANLYDVVFTLIKDGVAIDRRAFTHGVRTVELKRTSVTTSLGEGEFVFLVNGERIFAKGTNWVPVDAFHSRDRARIPKIMEMAEDLGINMIRCWGGNVYEDECFYDACDRLGILVWQDFSMACAVYPQDAAFQKALAAEAEKVVRRLRQHPCVALWAGDNECDMLSRMWMLDKVNPNDNILTRKTLPEVARVHDGSRPYIASSPYVDEKAAQYADEYLPEYHLWGPRDYFKSGFYINSLCHFVSEIGYHGCPSVDSIKKFISPDKLWPCLDNDEWLLHCTSPVPDAHLYDYRVKLMSDQICEMFKEAPGNLEDFAFASQAVQAEAKKFFIELFRSGKWRRTGILWWNLMDGWPQFSDAVVDYYFNKKLAYHFIKLAQQHVCVMMREPSDWVQQIVVSNDTPADADITVTVRDADSGELVFERSATAPADSVRVLGSAPFLRNRQRFFVIEWTGQASGRNHYLAGLPPFDLAAYRGWIKKCGLYEI